MDIVNFLTIDTGDDLTLSKIQDKEFERMIVVLKKMNFDNAFRLIKNNLSSSEWS